MYVSSNQTSIIAQGVQTLYHSKTLFYLKLFKTAHSTPFKKGSICDLNVRVFGPNGVILLIMETPNEWKKSDSNGGI